MIASASTPVHLGMHPPSSASKAKSLNAIMESQQLAVFANTYNIHFEQYLNERNKKVTRIIPYVVWKKFYAIYCRLIPRSPYRGKH